MPNTNYSAGILSDSWNPRKKNKNYSISHLHEREIRSYQTCIWLHVYDFKTVKKRFFFVNVTQPVNSVYFILFYLLVCADVMDLQKNSMVANIIKAGQGRTVDCVFMYGHWAGPCLTAVSVVPAAANMAYITVPCDKYLRTVIGLCCYVKHNSQWDFHAVR